MNEQRLTKRLRYAILERDGHRCRYCGATAEETSLTVDHVIPVSLGGRTEPSNLVAACRDCNAGKAATIPGQAITADVSRDAIRLRTAMQAMAYEASIDRAETERILRHIDRQWREWHPTERPGYEFPRPTDWRDSVERFIELGLTIEDICDAIDRAMRRTRGGEEGQWRYACGILWNWLQERQERAFRLIKAEARAQELASAPERVDP